MSPRHNLSFCACKTAWFAPEWQVYMGSSHYLLFFLHAKQWLYDQTYKSVLVPALNFVFCVQNSNFWRRIKSLYGSLTSPVILCMQNSVISITITSLYGSQPLSLDFACKPATFGAKLQVYLGPSPHLWFMYAKQRLVDQNTSPYVYQTSPVVLCIQTSVISTRITSLYVFQPSHVVLCIQNSDFWMGITNLYESQT